jgi:hypothetical protein
MPRRLYTGPSATRKDGVSVEVRVFHYLTARVGNSVTDNPSELGNYVTADIDRPEAVWFAEA